MGLYSHGGEWTWFRPYRLLILRTQIITGILPYQSNQSQSNNSAILRSITANVLPGDVTKMPELSYVARNLIADCWNQVPAARPTMFRCQLRLSSYSTQGTTVDNASDIHLAKATFSMNPVEVPVELKDGGQDWFTIFNPHAPKKLDIRQSFRFTHDRSVSFFSCRPLRAYPHVATPALCRVSDSLRTANFSPQDATGPPRSTTSRTGGSFSMSSQDYGVIGCRPIYLSTIARSPMS